MKKQIFAIALLILTSVGQTFSMAKKVTASDLLTRDEAAWTFLERYCKKDAAGNIPDNVKAQIARSKADILILAAQEGNVDITRKCLIAGAPINATDENGETAFYKAANHEKFPVAHLLLDQKGLDVETKSRTNHKKQTALHRLVVTSYDTNRTAHLAVVKRVIARKPNLNLLDDRQDTPLLYLLSGSSSYPELVYTLVKGGAQMIPNADNQTPLQLCLSENPAHVAAVLHAPDLSLADLKKVMAGCKKPNNNNAQYGYRLSFEVMKTYYNMMATLGYVNPLENEWRQSSRYECYKDFDLKKAKIIAAGVAEARFKMLHHAWFNC